MHIEAKIKIKAVANISSVRQHWVDTACTACTFLSSTPAVYVLFELVK
jgi:hypothetical protein